MIKSLSIALLAVCLVPPGAYAQEGPGTAGASFLKIGVGARQVAMGEAVAGLADDVNTMFYNPAGLAMLKRKEISMMHNNYLEGIKQEVGALAIPTRHFGTVGVGLNILKVDEFDSYDEIDRKIGTVDAQDMAASLSYAIEIGEQRRVAVGGTARYLRSRLDTYTASATMFDLGVLARYGLDGAYETRYRLGASVRNLGQEQKFISEGYKLPQSLHIGGSRDAPMPHPFEDMRNIVSLEMVIPNDDVPYAAGGLEVRIVREFALRVGYRMGQDLGFGLAVGFGFTSLHRGFVPKWVPELSMDYALVDYGLLEQAHRIGFSMRFGKPKYEQDEFDSLFDPTNDD